MLYESRFTAPRVPDDAEKFARVDADIDPL